MRFKIFDVNFYISVPFAVLMSFMLVTDKTGLMGISLFAVILHELGHLIAMKIIKCAPNSIELKIGGVLIRNKSFGGFKDSIIVSVSGPLFNLIAFVLLYISGTFLKSDFLLANAVVQIIVGGVNLLPVKGLDGGAVMDIILRCIMVRNVGLTTAVISILTACVVTVAGLAILVKNVSNPSLLLLGIYLIIINISRLNFSDD